jgi:hypothetical protein
LAADGAVLASNGEVLPNLIEASLDHAMADAATHFVERANRGIEAGAFEPDGLLYMKDGSVIYQEDQGFDTVVG